MLGLEIKHIKMYALLLIATSVASGCAVTPVRQHPDFADAIRGINSVTVIPADVEYLYIVYNGDNQRVPKEEEAISETLDSTLPDYLEKRGYKVIQFDQKKLGKDAAFAIQQLKTAYNEATKVLYEKGKVSKSEAYNFRTAINPEVINPVVDALKTDGVIVTRYYGFNKSGGVVAQEVVTSALLAVLTGAYGTRPTSGASMEMALIDGASGNVLWANRVGAGNATAPRLAEALTRSLPHRDKTIARADKLAQTTNDTKQETQKVAESTGAKPKTD